MESEIKCPILTSEKFSKEVLTDIVNSLEQLENAKNTIFNRLNSAFSERVNKLCNIKARINRANKIIASYSSLNDALTLKSKYHYPSKKHIFYTPTIIDQNATSVNKVPPLKLNRIVLNEKEKLGSKSLAAKDKIVTYDKYLSFATQFNDIVNELDKVANQEINVRQSLDEFEPILNHVTSDFTFGTKMKIEYAKKQQYNPQQEIANRGTSIVLQDFLNEKKAEEEKRKKVIQEAPQSIIQKVKIKKYRKKRKKLKNSARLNFNLPTNIGLGGVAELGGGDDDDEKNEDNKEEEEDEDDEYFEDDGQNENDPQLDNQDDDMPIDYISYNKARNENNKNAQNIPVYYNNNNNNINQNNQNNNTNNNVNNNINENPNPAQVQVNPNPVPAPPEPPKQPVVQQPKVQPPPAPQPRAPNPPPTVPNNSNVVVIVGKAGVPPPPPPPPPPPMVPIVPTNANDKKVEKKNDGPELSLEEELQKAMSGLKKKVNVEIKQKPKELSFAEQLALSRNKLKKAVIPPKPPEKKQNAKDLLSQQIRLRFQNLRMHEEEKEEDSDEDDWNK